MQKQSTALQVFTKRGCGGFDIRQRRLQDVLQLQDGDRAVEREEHRLERGGQSGRVPYVDRAAQFSFLSWACTVISANAEGCATRASPILISSSSARNVTTASNRVRACWKTAEKFSCGWWASICRRWSSLSASDTCSSSKVT